MTTYATDQSLKQQYQGSSHGKSKEGSADTLNFAGRLFEACFKLFSLLTREIQATDEVTKAGKHGIYSELERFCLWGEGFSARDGGLDRILESSAELRANVLSLLLEFGKVVARDLFKSINPPTSAGALYTNHKELQGLLEDVQGILSNANVTPDSDISENDFEEILDDLKAYNDCLMDLTPALERPALDTYTDDRHLSKKPVGEHPKYVIVGVDIGLACTGVAVYSDNLPELIIIRHWPGSDTLVNKVPTAIAYRAGFIRPRSWGLECPAPWKVGREIAVMQLFKFVLDEDFLQEALYRNPDGAPDIDDVRAWYRDFLTNLHEHILSHLKAVLQVNSKLTKVDYVFSLPTVWGENNRIVERFGDILGEAGFGSGERSSVIIGLTEAEASAVQTAVSGGVKYKEGDVLLVCDAGGTTGLSVIQVERIVGGVINMKLVDTPIVLAAGSLQIDDTFEKKIKKDLMANGVEDLELSEYTAKEITHGDFQAIKRSFGTGLLPQITELAMPGFPDAKVHISWNEIRAMFDEELVKIFEFIDMQLLRAGRLKLNVSYIVLSGGLGSSEYVQRRVGARFADINVLFDQDPPLAVCKGLVLDRMQRIFHRTSILHKLRCHASYGVLCSERYDKNRHRGQTPVKSPLDGKCHVANQIDWFIRKGEIITEDVPIIRRCWCIIGCDSPRRGWRDTIVMSYNTPDCLPHILDEGGTCEVCTIVTYLGPDVPDDDTPSTKMKSRWKAPVKKFTRAEYELLAIVKGESLKFRTRVNGKEKGETEVVLAPWIFTQDAEDGSKLLGGVLEIQATSSVKGHSVYTTGQRVTRDAEKSDELLVA